MSSTYSWSRSPRGGHSWEELRPYDRCPNCGKYKYRKLRMRHAGIIRYILRREPYYTVYSSCKSCKYQTQMESVSEDQF